MFEIVTIYPEYTSSILPKPKNFDRVTSVKLRLPYPKKANLGTPDLKSEKLLRERKVKRVQDRQFSYHETKTPISTRAHFLRIRKLFCPWS